MDVRTLEHPDADALYEAVSASRDTCNDCGDPINWAKTSGRNRIIPLNVELADSPGRLQFLIEPKGKKLVAHFVDRFYQAAGKVGYESHLSTCPAKQKAKPLTGDAKTDQHLASTITPERQARIDATKKRDPRLGEGALQSRPISGESDEWGEDV